MTDSLATGADGQANHALSIWRNDQSEGYLGADVTFIPGFKLNADPALELQGKYRSPKGQILELDARTGQSPGSWVGLHLALPIDDLTHTGVIGFAARISAPEVLVARTCLRSGTKDGFQDSFFDKHILLRPEQASHVDALSVARRPDIPDRAPWRELVFFLPSKAFQLSLIDLRVFAV